MDPPDFDFYEDEDEFEEQCREELRQWEEDEMLQGMVPVDEEEKDDFEREMQEKNENGKRPKPLESPGEKGADSSLYTSPQHELYRSPEVYKELNKDFLRGRKRNVGATALSFTDSAMSKENDFMAPLQSNSSRRGPQIQRLLPLHQLTTQLNPFVHLNSAEVSNFLDDRPGKSTHSDYPTVTLSSGKRKYLRGRTSHCNLKSMHSCEGILSQPMTEILKEAEKRKAEKLAFESEASFDTKDAISSVHKSGKSELWVDKYSPRSFTQLLSSEKINREVLRCVKLWDKFVFGKSTENAQKRYYDFKGNVVSKEDFLMSTKPYDRNSSIEKDSEDSDSRKPKEKKDTRPEYKLILLAGPPGTGKTTLAHVVARHCGYRTIEVNASDDRSVESLRDIISRSNSNNTLDEHFLLSDSADGDGDFKTRKPNCIILDEIDGMDGRQPIDALVAIARTALDSGNNKTKKKDHIVQTRPIICICNDQFSPMLRELRKQAKVFVFSSATESRLVSRLKQICSLEKLGNVASSSLSALAQACGGDIRSAINTLQFASMRAKEIIGTSHSDKLNLKHADTASLQSTLGALLTTGLKDERQDVFRLWSQIFSFKEAAARFTKKFHMIAGGGGVAESSTGGAEGSARASHAMKVLDAVYAYNDHQLVISGVQENYLSIRYTDPSLLKTCSAADWISTANILEGNVGEASSHFTDMYIPAAVAVVHLLCASDTRQNPRIQYPKKDASCHFNMRQRGNVLHQFYEGGCIRSPCIASKMVCALDCVPLILDVLSLGWPGVVRPGPMQMQSDVEKMRIQRAAEVMVSCGLSYERQTVTDSERDAGKSYRLDPSIEMFTQYDEKGDEYKERRAIRETNNEVKHILYLEVRSRIQKAAHIAELQPNDENTNETVQHGDGKNSNEKEAEFKEGNTAGKHDSDMNTVSGNKRALADVESTASEKKPKAPPGQFFGFMKKQSSSLPPQASKTSGRKGNVQVSKPLRYKYCSGFSNAVKRPVSIKEFCSMNQ